MTNNKVKLLDIEFDARLINVLAISKSVNFSYTYTRKLIYGTKRNKKSQWKLRNTIVKLYGSLIKFVPYELNIKPKEKAA